MPDNRSNKHGELIAKAWADEAFKARLKNDPKAAMKELGIDPPAMELQVVESTPQKMYLVIPPKPTGELSDQALDKIAGGGWGDFVSKFDTFCGCSC